jgi:transcription initiation factor TFIID TATA-box-binding protein
MNEVNIENIIASTLIASSLDLEAASKALPGSVYNKEDAHVLRYHMSKPNIAVLLFKDGGAFLLGGRSIAEYENAVNIVRSTLSINGVKINEKSDINIYKVVGSRDLNKKINISYAAKKLKKDKNDVSYNPDEFPGIIYRLNDPNTVIFLFDSGRMIGMGNSTGDVAVAFDHIKDRLSYLKII